MDTEISRIRFANAVQCGSDNLASYSKIKGFQITLERQGLIKIRHLASGNEVYSSIMNMIEMTPVGALKTTGLAPTYVENNTPEPLVEHEERPIQYGANGKPIPRFGERSPERHLVPTTAGEEDRPTADNPGFQPKPIPTYAGRQKAKLEAEGLVDKDSQKPATTGKNGKGKNLNADSEEEVETPDKD